MSNNLSGTLNAYAFIIGTKTGFLQHAFVTKIPSWWKKLIFIRRNIVSITESSRTIFDSPCIPIDPNIANVFGSKPAAFLQQVHYWVTEKQLNPDQYKSSFKQGHFWVYMSAKEISENFPFLGSERSVKRMINALKKACVLVVDRFNRLAADKTNWYRINYEALRSFLERQGCQVGPIQRPKSPERRDKMAQAIPQTSSKTSTKTTAKSAEPAAAFSLTLEEEELLKALVEHNVHDGPGQNGKCLNLIRTFGPERIKRQIEYESLRPKAESPAARLVAAIKADYAPPVQAQQAQESEQAAAEKAEKKSAIAAFLEKAREAVELVIESSGARYVIERVNPSGGLDLRDASGNVASVPAFNLLGRAQFVMQ